jgi:hypothetical protein
MQRLRSKSVTACLWVRRMATGWLVHQRIEST